MLHHVSVGATDVARAAQFYDAVLSTLGFKRVMEVMPYGIAYGIRMPQFWVQLPHDQGTPSGGNGTHIAFNANSQGAVHAFHAAALASGGRDEGAPGPRPEYTAKYYGAFVRDPYGNKIEAVFLPMEPARPAKKAAARKSAAKKSAKPKAKKRAAQGETQTLMQKSVQRCAWPGVDDLYVAYHDDEWGVPEYDHRALYEKLILDGFQAGLSWITILRKRENFRRAFDNFNPEKVARYGKRERARLMKDAGIIRSNAKIDAAIAGAQLWLDIMEKEKGGFSELIWKHVDGKPKINRFRDMKDIPAKTEMSEKLSKELKQRGFKFVGPTIVYAFAQAVGMVNDHVVSCYRHKQVQSLAR